MDPGEIDQAMHQALQRHRQGDLAGAENIYRKVLTDQADHVPALHFLALIAGQSGKIDIAIQLLLRVIQVSPAYADPYSNLGNFLRECGRLEESAAACRRAIELQPNAPEAHNNLANTLRDQHKF